MKLDSVFLVTFCFLTVTSLSTSIIKDEKSLDELKRAFIRYFEPLSVTGSNRLEVPPKLLIKYIEEAKAENKSQLTELWEDVQVAVNVELKLYQSMMKVKEKISKKSGPKRAKWIATKWKLVKDEFQWALTETERKVMLV